MESLRSRTTSAIIRLLNSKRDGMILLTGDWGTGKTYYITHNFASLYDQKTIFHISLLGINNLDDFKAKIINTCYLENAENFKRAAETTSNSLCISTGNSESAGLINSIFQSISTGIKEYVLTNLRGLFIIDDIERVENDIILSDILNYCHSLYTNAEANSLDVILLGNFESQFEINLKHREKIISDTLIFSPSSEDIKEMINPLINFMDSISEIKFFELIEHHKIKNIRVIKKIIQKIEPFISKAKSEDENNCITSIENIISIIMAIIIARDIYNQNKNNLLEFNTTRNLSQEKANDNLQKIMEIASSYYSVKLMPYVFNEQSFTNIENEIFLPLIKLTPRQIAVSDDPRFYNIAENCLLGELISIINRQGDESLPEWLKAVSNYNFLSLNKYIEESQDLTEDIIMNISDGFSNQELINLFENNQKYTNTPDIIVRSRLSTPIEKKLYSRYKEIKRTTLVNRIIYDVVNFGWSNFDTSRIDKTGNLGQFKPIEIIGSSTIIKCIWRGHWTSMDIENFKHYIDDLYNFNNVKDFLLNEKELIREIIKKLDLYLGLKKISFRYGAVLELNKTLIKCQSRLDD
ncbi:TPA: hypothetical protein PXM42_002014 [Yersinia enterocolitica]|uniref:AAA family ATPase n=1 Tax=Yersinia enterocolitica TaxID=630 RepID=UPI00330E45C3|nr:hypothetical protein [Yersinia enterocolitica]